MSAAASHLGLLDRVVPKAVRHSDGLVACDFEHRRRVAALCLFYKIRGNAHHALEAAVFFVHVLAMLTLVVLFLFFPDILMFQCIALCNLVGSLLVRVRNMEFFV